MHQLALAAVFLSATFGTEQGASRDEGEEPGFLPSRSAERAAKPLVVDPNDWYSSIPGCHRIRSILTRYLDAYTGGDGDVVTRDLQNDGTQTWCFKLVPGYGTLPVFTIQHRSFGGQFLDAYETQSDHKAVLRNAQTDETQYWQLYYHAETQSLQVVQYSTRRALHALVNSAEDYRAVTRVPNEEPAPPQLPQRFWLE